ncbi:hypothetical protein CON64_21600 [Bacillus pseudomycoides]|nr:hypothetical protein CON64_21600 [Bacillus pseudomycoides]
MTNKKFNEEFKKMVVQLSSEYGVSEVTVYKWIKIYSPITSVDEDEMTRAKSRIVNLKSTIKEYFLMVDFLCILAVKSIFNALMK